MCSVKTVKSIFKKSRNLIFKDKAEFLKHYQCIVLLNFVMFNDCKIFYALFLYFYITSVIFYYNSHTLYNLISHQENINLIHTHNASSPCNHCSFVLALNSSVIYEQLRITVLVLQWQIIIFVFYIYNVLQILYLEWIYQCILTQFQINILIKKNSYCKIILYFLVKQNFCKKFMHRLFIKF